DVVIEFGDIASPDPASALLSYARENDVDLVLSEFPRETRATRRFINEMKDMRDHLEADSIFLRNRSLGQVGTIAIMGSGGPYDVFKISLATRIARAEGSRLRFIHVLPEDATDAQVESVDSYHHQLQELVDVETESVVARAADLIPKIDTLAADSDLVVIGAATHRVRLFGDLADRIADSLEAPVMMVHTRDFPRPTWLEATLERLIY
ncbi:MAG: universal stress protein, partial [Acidimicrobiia bacterium]